MARPVSEHTRTGKWLKGIPAAFYLCLFPRAQSLDGGSLGAGNRRFQWGERRYEKHPRLCPQGRSKGVHFRGVKTTTYCVFRKRNSGRTPCILGFLPLFCTKPCPFRHYRRRALNPWYHFCSSRHVPEPHCGYPTIPSAVTGIPAAP